MSQCEDLELKNLVTEALENNGVLAKIRAQLRANIFMALEEENEMKHLNPSLKDVLDTRNGSIAFMLVQELLDYCNLVQTSSVFKSETGQGKMYVYEGRDLLLSKHLKVINTLQNCTTTPILVQLIQILFEIKLNGMNHEDKLINIDDKSLEESVGAGNIDTQNNTFVVNSGRSDNYDLSFVSDADSSNSSIAPNDKKIIANSTESSESISTELNGDKSKSGDYEDLKQEDSVTSVVESDADIKNSFLDSPRPQVFDNVALSPPTKVENKDSNNSGKSIKSTSNTYSKYLKEKQNGSPMLTNESHKKEEFKTNEDSGPVDIVMRHVIQSRILDRQVSESGEEESLSEELQAFEKSNGATETSISISISEDHSDNTNKSMSPVKNILDETIPESPNTKKQVINNINSLKRSLRITDDDEIVFSDSDIKLNLKNLDVKSNNKNKSLDILKNNEKNKLMRINNETTADILSVLKKASNEGRHSTGDSSNLNV